MKRNFHVPFLGGWGAATPPRLPDRKEPYLMKVFVLSKEGKPLMPTTPRRARLWLATKRARVVRRDPFTIRLRFATRAHVQPAKVGVDTGSKEVGIAARQSGGDRQGRALGRLVLAGWPGHGRSRQV